MNRPVCACVYHPSQKLTNFCRNEECLLPLCPRCVSIHVQDHNHNHTTAMIYTLDYMVQQIRESFQQARNKTKVLETVLLKIQDNKKANESKAKAMLKENMQRVRDEVERELEKIEKDFMVIINKYGEETIKELQQIDGLLEQESRKCQRNLAQLDSDVFLKALITIEESNHMGILEDDIEEMSGRINDLQKTKIDISPNWFPLGSLRKSIREIFGYKQHAPTASHTPNQSPIK